MKKLIRFLLVAQLVCLLILAGMLIADKVTLRRDLIRLHVVAASDGEGDQAVKLLVRDAVTAQTQELLQGIENAVDARQILEENLCKLENAANAVLKNAGSADRAKVTLQKEAFPVRHYETFSLPSGVYQSLRVSIGEAQGQNWWCVVFPSLCMNGTTDADVSASSGFSDSLNGALTGDGQYKISFFFLDCFGKLENFFFS